MSYLCCRSCLHTINTAELPRPILTSGLHGNAISNFSGELGLVAFAFVTRIQFHLKSNLLGLAVQFISPTNVLNQVIAANLDTFTMTSAGSTRRSQRIHSPVNMFTGIFNIAYYAICPILVTKAKVVVEAAGFDRTAQANVISVATIKDC